MDIPQYSICLGESLLSLSTPCVMGILNCTPDSFFAGSRTTDEAAIAMRARQIEDEGGAIIDVGACSTRPDSDPVSEEEEVRRLRHALPLVRKAAPRMPLSVDTYRPKVAQMCVEEYGVKIINDVGQTATHTLRSEEDTKEMFRMVAKLRVAYVLTSSEPTLNTMLPTMAHHIEELHSLGVADVIADPGFGFGKTLEQNYAILRQLEQLHLLRVPMLVGVSRKSMFTRLLNIPTQEAANATTVAHTIALLQGTQMLRTHDVRAAAEAISITEALKQSK